MFIVIDKGRITKFKEKLDWCKECFGPGVEVVGPTQASLYRWSYEFVGFGLRQIFFRDKADYVFYTLKYST